MSSVSSVDVVPFGGGELEDLTIDGDQDDGVTGDHAARTDGARASVTDAPSWSNTVMLASLPTFCVVTTRSSLDRQRPAGEVRRLVAIEREQHALEVAGVGDQHVATRRRRHGGRDVVPGTGDRREGLGVEHVAARTVDEHGPVAEGRRRQIVERAFRLAS